MYKQIASALLLGSFLMGSRAGADVYVVTTDTTLEDIAKRVGGNKVTVESLARAGDDPHQVDPRPSMVVKLARAKVFARIGMDLDIWVPAILDKSGNSQVQVGGKGYCDCSQNLRILEAPTAKLDPSQGDVHVYGNPHYLLDPANGILAAGNIAAALIRVDPANQPYYHQRFQDFGKEVVARLAKWKEKLASVKGLPVVTYHRSWVYFLARFGLKEYGTVEPKPGIPPSPGHINDLVKSMKADGVKVLLTESFRSARFPTLISEQSGAKVVSVPVAVDADPAAGDYFKLFDTIVDRLAAGFR